MHSLNSNQIQNDLKMGKPEKTPESTSTNQPEDTLNNAHKDKIEELFNGLWVYC